MSSILIRGKRVGTQNYRLLWEKDKGYVVRENGYEVNHYGGISKKKALQRFSSKLYNIKNPKWKRNR